MAAQKLRMLGGCQPSGGHFLVETKPSVGYYWHTMVKDVMEYSRMYLNIPTNKQVHVRISAEMP